MTNDKSSSFTQKIRDKIKDAQQHHPGEYLSLLPADDSPPPDSDTDKAHFSTVRARYEAHLDTLNQTPLTAVGLNECDELLESLDQLNRNVAELTGDSGSSSFLKRIIRKIINIGIGNELNGINKALSSTTRIVNALNQKTKEFSASQQAFNTETAVFGQQIIPVIDEKIRRQIDIVSGYLKDRMDAYHMGTDRRQTEIANWLQNTSKMFEDTIHRFTRLENEVKRGLALQHRKLEQVLKQKDTSMGTITHNDKHNNHDQYASAGGDYAYYLFETQGRGPETFVRELQSDYVRFFMDSPGPILDVGCGRGEFLELLRQNGLDASGVDSNPDMVAICRGKELDVVERDTLAYLETLPDESLGGVFAGQVVEHLTSIDLNCWLKQVFRVLKTDGILVFETINIGSLFALTTHFYKDPTHQPPRHPDTYRFLTEIAGFDNVTITFRSPVDKSVKPLIAPLPNELHNVDVDPMLQSLRRALEQTIDYIYSPCDIVVYGRKPEIMA